MLVIIMTIVMESSHYDPALVDEIIIFYTRTNKPPFTCYKSFSVILLRIILSNNSLKLYVSKKYHFLYLRSTYSILSEFNHHQCIRKFTNCYHVCYLPMATSNWIYNQFKYRTKHFHLQQHPEHNNTRSSAIGLQDYQK